MQAIGAMEGSVMTMSALLIDGAMIGTTLLAGRSIAGSWKQFKQLFAQLREEMAATDPIRTISAITSPPRPIRRRQWSIAPSSAW
jgi:hypothetical protein